MKCSSKLNGRLERLVPTNHVLSFPNYQLSYRNIYKNKNSYAKYLKFELFMLILKISREGPWPPALYTALKMKNFICNKTPLN